MTVTNSYLSARRLAEETLRVSQGTTLRHAAKRLAIAACLGLFIGIPLSERVTASTLPPAGGWLFLDEVAGKPMPVIRYRANDLFSSLFFDRESREWRLLLISAKDLPTSGKMTLRATYDADPARNRPHRVEMLESEPRLVTGILPELADVQGAAVNARVIRLALPHTFIIHLQGADRVDIEAGGIGHTIAMKGSAKAIAEIYRSIGEGRGGEGKSITEIVNDNAAPTASSTRQSQTAGSEEPVATVYAGDTPKNTVKRKATEFRCVITQEEDPVDYWQCIDEFIQRVQAAAQGDEEYLAEHRQITLTRISRIYGEYIEQDWPDTPGMVCKGFHLPYDEYSRRHPQRIQANIDEWACLKHEAEWRGDNMVERAQRFSNARLGIDFLGEVALKKAMDETLDTHFGYNHKWKEDLQVRFRSAWEERKYINGEL